MIMTVVVVCYLDNDSRSCLFILFILFILGSAGGRRRSKGDDDDIGDDQDEPLDIEIPITFCEPTSEMYVCVDRDNDCIDADLSLPVSQVVQLYR